MPVIGTAGHVDHGKSTLVRAITGRDPDRWEEEKRRGLTIDLGFAWATLPGGVEVSFVDVPGHERFIKNMLAGVEAIDLALLVVAADEGWMPQSEEHLAVLDLLGVSTGVAALTKIDRVDPDLIQLATLEVEERLRGTSLQGIRVIPVSPISGAGLEELTNTLGMLAAAVSVEDRRRPRLWIDRVFTISGAGTVVTGTLLGGKLRVGDQVEIWPGPLTGRIRALQSHERAREEVSPGRRVAINLTGVSKDQLARGSMLGRPGQWTPTPGFLAEVRPARYVEELSNRGAFQLHVGSAAVPVRLRLLDQNTAFITLPRPFALEVGDRFILRDTGRRLVVGGGRVLDPRPLPPRRLTPDVISLLRRSADAEPARRAEALLQVHGVVEVNDLANRTGGGSPSQAFVVGDTAISPDRAADLQTRMVEEVNAYHAAHPLRPGIPLAQLADRLHLSHEVATALADRHPELKVDGAAVRHRSFTEGRSPAEEEAWQRARSRLRETGPGAAPRSSELGLSPELIHALTRQGELVRISDQLVYLPEQVAELTSVLESFDEPFTVSQFRERAGLSRKYAVPFLEWADSVGLTVRMGDRRRVRRPGGGSHSASRDSGNGTAGQ